MWTFQNFCVAHARRVDDVLLDEYYLQGSELETNERNNLW